VLRHLSVFPSASSLWAELGHGGVCFANSPWAGKSGLSRAGQAPLLALRTLLDLCLVRRPHRHSAPHRLGEFWTAAQRPGNNTLALHVALLYGYANGRRLTAHGEDQYPTSMDRLLTPDSTKSSIACGRAPSMSIRAARLSLSVPAAAHLWTWFKHCLASYQNESTNVAFLVHLTA
jgi:hypothetical protein